MKDNRYSGRTRHILDIIVAFIVLLIPLCLYLHLLWDTGDNIIDVFGIEYQTKFANTSIYIWFVLSHVIPLTLLLIWYSTNYYWWRYSILSPVLFNLYVLFRDATDFSIIVLGYHNVTSIMFALLILTLLVIVDKLLFTSFRDSRFNNSVREVFDDRVFYHKIIAQLDKSKNLDSKYSSEYQSLRLYHIKQLLNEKLQIYRNYKFRNSHFAVKKTDVVIGFVIFVIPVLFLSYNLIPTGIKEVSLIGMTFHDNGFKDLNTFYWFLLIKLCVIIPLVIWFYTSKNWWRYAILSPIILYTYQFWEAMQDVQHLDAYGNLKAFPAVFTVIFLLVVLSNVFKYRYGLLDMYEEIDAKLEELISNAALDKLSEMNEVTLYEKIIGKKMKEDNHKSYLQELNDLRDKLQYQIDVNITD